jgi:ribosomal protein S7
MYKKFILKNNINLYHKIFGFFVKNGKKNKSLKLLNSAFLKICKIMKRPIYYLLIKLFIILNVFVETKTVRTRRSVHIVPFPLNLKRRIYLVIKWISFVIDKNKEKISFSEKLVKEIFFILKKKKSEVLKLKISNNSRALLNRSNIHYRW